MAFSLVYGFTSYIKIDGSKIVKKSLLLFSNSTFAAWNRQIRPDVVGQTSNPMLELTLNESGDLLSYFCGDLMDEINQLLQGNRPVKYANFIAEQIEQSTNGPLVCTFPVLPGKQDVAW